MAPQVRGGARACGRTAHRSNACLRAFSLPNTKPSGPPLPKSFTDTSPPPPPQRPQQPPRSRRRSTPPPPPPPRPPAAAAAAPSTTPTARPTPAISGSSTLRRRRPRAGPGRAAPRRRRGRRRRRRRRPSRQSACGTAKVRGSCSFALNSRRRQCGPRTGRLTHPKPARAHSTIRPTQPAAVRPSGTFTAGGYSYEGEWADDAMAGQGSFRFASGAEYVGSWAANKYEGQGAYSWPDGRRYEVRGSGAGVGARGRRLLSCR
jgi:hypothetical protein